jgi:hypothetical protein
VFIWNMFSLNGMRPFGGRPNTKTVRARPKADNIISFRARCYIWAATSLSRLLSRDMHGKHHVIMQLKAINERFKTLSKLS